MEDKTQGKQDTIIDGGLSTTKIFGLDTNLSTFTTDTIKNESDISTINKNNLIYNQMNMELKRFLTGYAEHFQRLEIGEKSLMLLNYIYLNP